MSYISPSNDLDDSEICSYIEMSTKLSIPDLIRYIWKAGYEWGYEVGYEEGKEE